MAMVRMKWSLLLRKKAQKNPYRYTGCVSLADYISNRFRESAKSQLLSSKTIIFSYQIF